MPKSRIQQLQEAINGGDMERAKLLADQLAPKPKPKTKAKSTKPPSIKSGSPRPRVDVEDGNIDESDYIAPARANGFHPTDGRKFIGEDGKEHRYARRVSMAGTKFVNRFKPDDYDRVPASATQIDKKFAKKKRAVSARPPAKKVKTQCSMCGDTVEVYPWEIESVDGQMSYRCSKRGCVKRG